MATLLGEELATRGHAVHYVSYAKPTRLSVFHKNIFYHQVSTKPYPLFAHLPHETHLTSKIVEVCRKYPIDVVHVHYAIPHASAAYLAREIMEKYENRYIPFITTLHGTDITLVGRNSAYKPVVDFSISASDAVTSVSEDLKKETCSSFRVHPRDISVIHNFAPRSRKEAHTQQGGQALRKGSEKLIVHVSNFRRVKRTRDVVEVFLGIQKKIPARLLLIGDGPETEAVEERCGALALHERVHFYGPVEEVAPILCGADLFLLPSEKESFGLAALEAMACGVPVVASRVGGLPEVVESGVSGFLCPLGDIEAMTAQALYILDDGRLPRFKKAAMRRAGQFSPNKIVPMYEALYKRVREQADVKRCDS